jgi:hypothetical protein
MKLDLSSIKQGIDDQLRKSAQIPSQVFREAALSINPQEIDTPTAGSMLSGPMDLQQSNSIPALDPGLEVSTAKFDPSALAKRDIPSSAVASKAVNIPTSTPTKQLVNFDQPKGNLGTGKEDILKVKPETSPTFVKQPPKYEVKPGFSGMAPSMPNNVNPPVSTTPGPSLHGAKASTAPENPQAEMPNPFRHPIKAVEHLVGLHGKSSGQAAVKEFSGQLKELKGYLDSVGGNFQNILKGDFGKFFKGPGGTLIPAALMAYLLYSMRGGGGGGNKAQNITVNVGGQQQPAFFTQRGVNSLGMPKFGSAAEPMQLSGSFGPALNFAKNKIIRPGTFNLPSSSANGPITSEPMGLKGVGNKIELDQAPGANMLKPFSLGGPVESAKNLDVPSGKRLDDMLDARRAEEAFQESEKRVQNTLQALDAAKNKGNISLTPTPPAAHASEAPPPSTDWHATFEKVKDFLGNNALPISLGVGGTALLYDLYKKHQKEQAELERIREAQGMSYKSAAVLDAVQNTIRNRMINNVLDKVVPAKEKKETPKDEKEVELTSKYPEIATMLEDKHNKAYLERLLKD